MDYQEALDFKNSQKENPFFKDCVEYVWMVVPKTEKYFNEYAEDNLTTDEIFFDETAIRYAKDGLFKIFGVRMRR
ncbi:hypothetical protein J2X31_001929 [Flavobacterium arsenatis]|uniref:Transposase n=1 Tax=Flavobacterium arsenatis TaxID=1484332 RepID=A0ABU1TPK5_9FLAO|nr:hypothetical protein [Flavobacterium arsenatis]MDR6967915.1 hypothetical protein [Flavobacterium arsenatis]